MMPRLCAKRTALSTCIRIPRFHASRSVAPNRARTVGGVVDQVAPRLDALDPLEHDERMPVLVEAEVVHRHDVRDARASR